MLKTGELSRAASSTLAIAAGERWMAPGPAAACVASGAGPPQHQGGLMSQDNDFRRAEIGSIYVSADDRFVVSLVVGYHPDQGSNEELDLPLFTPNQAALAALELTRDGGAADTMWHVFDRATGVLHRLPQEDFDPQCMAEACTACGQPAPAPGSLCINCEAPRRCASCGHEKPTADFSQPCHGRPGDFCRACTPSPRT